MAPVEESNNDSGMESQDGSLVQDINSPENSPEKEKRPQQIEGEYEDEPDESVSERLWGLTEMFPEPVRNATEQAVCLTGKSIRTFYSLSRTAFWVVFSSSIILFAPVIFEVERANMEEMQRNQQKQMLLGPSTAMSGGGMPLMPPVQR